MHIFYLLGELQLDDMSRLDKTEQSASDSCIPCVYLFLQPSVHTSLARELYIIRHVMHVNVFWFICLLAISEI